MFWAPSVSPSGAETLHLLARTGAGVDLSYRDELIERFALDPSRTARTYSTGTRQQVALIAAFATRAPLLVLDEPTSGLDPLMEREFRTAVALARDRGQSVFLSSHQLAEVEAVCDPGRDTPRRTPRGGRLRRRSSHTAPREVTVTYAGTPPALAAVPGDDAVENTGQARLRFTLSGPPAPALIALADADVTAFAASRSPGGLSVRTRGCTPRATSCTTRRSPVRSLRRAAEVMSRRGDDIDGGATGLAPDFEVLRWFHLPPVCVHPDRVAAT